MIRFVLIGVLMTVCCMSETWGQQDSLTIEEKIMQEYQKRIRKSHINGFYIPVDLDDALRMLDEIVDEQGKRKFMSQEEDYAVSNVFFSFGRWINVNWGIEGGSRLTVALNKLGLDHPDDMVYFLMHSFYRHLKNQDLESEDLIRKIVEKRREREKAGRNKEIDKPR